MIFKDFETAFINYSLANKQPDSNLIEFSYKKYPDNYFDLSKSDFFSSCYFKKF